MQGAGCRESARSAASFERRERERRERERRERERGKRERRERERRERERREREEREKTGYEPFPPHAAPYTRLYRGGEVKWPSGPPNAPPPLRRGPALPLASNRTTDMPLASNLETETDSKTKFGALRWYRGTSLMRNRPPP